MLERVEEAAKAIAVVSQQLNRFAVTFEVFEELNPVRFAASVDEANGLSYEVRTLKVPRISGTGCSANADIWMALSSGQSEEEPYTGTCHCIEMD